MSQKTTENGQKTPENTTEKPEKIPGPAMRFIIKAQAGLNLFSAAATPLLVKRGIDNGGINVPLPGGSKHFDLTSTTNKNVAIGIAAVSTVYGSLNAISRVRTAQDAETAEKIAKGKIEPEDAKMHSKRLDVVLTRMNAGVSGAVSLATGAFAVRSLFDPSLTADQKTDKVVGAAAAMVATGVMSASKWRAANSAQKHLDAQKTEQQATPQTHTQRIEQERSQDAEQSPSRG